jgi:hypothetical protein
MSITTYTELQTAIGNWLDRSDLSSRIPEFISLFEAKVNRRLRVRQQMASTTLSPSNGSATLPTDYLEWKRVTWNGATKRVLAYVDPQQFDGIDPDSPSGDPQRFTIEGSTLKIMPIDTTSLTFLYAQQVPVLSGINTTNWLLTAFPDAYLYGSLAEASSFTEDIQGGPIFDGLAKEALSEIWSLSFASQGPAAMRTVGPTP